MIQQEFVSEIPGAASLRLELPSGYVQVTVDPKVNHARIVVRTRDDTGPAADAVRLTRITQCFERLGVSVPEVATNAAFTVRQGADIRGLVIRGGNFVSLSTPAASRVEVEITLPSGSDLDVTTTSADIVVRGALNRLNAVSVSGDVDTEEARDARVSTVSGLVAFKRVTGQLSAQSVSGDVMVLDYRGTAAELNSTSGNLRVNASGSARGSVRASSTSGSVRVRGINNVVLLATSLSGVVHTR